MRTSWFVGRILVSILVLSSVSGCGNTPLHTAAFDGNQSDARTLLAQGASVNARNDFGHRPLHSAARQGQLDVAEMLLSHGAEVDARDNRGNTPLHLTAMYGQSNVAALLLAHGADVNARNNDGETPLYIAAHMGWPELAYYKVLLAYGADVNARANNGRSPLEEAIITSRTDRVALLKDAVAIQKLRATQVEKQTRQEEGRWEDATRPSAVHAQNEQQAGHADQAFTDYLHILRNTPAESPFTTTPYYENLLRGLLDTARQLKTLPPISQEYRREMVVALDAIKTATTDEDFQRAETHFLKASRLAPWAPQPYEALGHVLESLKKYKEAAVYLKLYLLVQPNTPNAQSVQDHIYVLEGRER